MVGVDQAKIDADCSALLNQVTGPTVGGDGHRVEEVLGDSKSNRLQGDGETRRQAMNVCGDGGQPLGPVPGGIGGGHVGQESLGGANVRCRLLPTDVLLPGLKRQPIGGAAPVIHRDANQSAGQTAHVPFGRGHEPGMGTAETHGYAEALSRADHHVGPHLARWCQQTTGQEVGGDRHQATGLMDGFDQRRQIPHLAG